MMQRWIMIAALALAGAAAAGAATNGPALFDWGPIAAREQLITGEIRYRAAGPFYEDTAAAAGATFWGLRPFYTLYKNPAGQRVDRSSVWPCFTASDFLNARRWRLFLLAAGATYDLTDPNSAWRTWIIPIYFQGRARTGEEYLGIFPFGGTVRDVLFFDRLSFVMFPFWMQEQVGTQVTDNILWPLVSWTEGPYNHRFRVAPFYGRSVRDGYYDKNFVMWPIWTWTRFTSPGSEGWAYIVWPLWGQVQRKEETGFMLAPPLIRFSWGPRARMVNCPWPFVQYYKSATFYRFWLWPLWGRRDIGGIHNSFMLWPLLWYGKHAVRDQVTQTYQFIPFVLSKQGREGVSSNRPGVVTRRFTRVWPLGAYKRVGAVRQTRFFDFWPFEEDVEVERAWAPFWTLFTHTVAPAGYQTEALWGLYRRERRGHAQAYTSVFPLFSWESRNGQDAARKFELFKGLLGYAREDGQTRLRLLYFTIPLGRTPGEEQPL